MVSLKNLTNFIAEPHHYRAVTSAWMAELAPSERCRSKFNQLLFRAVLPSCGAPSVLCVPNKKYHYAHGQLPTHRERKGYVPLEDKYGLLSPKLWCD